MDLRHVLMHASAASQQGKVVGELPWAIASWSALLAW
jgi:hypothetical protein